MLRTNVTCMQMSGQLHAYAHKVCGSMYAAFEAEASHSRHLSEAAAVDTPIPPISVDVSFLFNCGYMVFFMQLGFAAVCIKDSRVLLL
jgi:hypothetical protein